MISENSVERQICEYLEGDLDLAQMKRLEGDLENDSDAMELLCLHALMHAGMRQQPFVTDHRAERLVAKQKRHAFHISLATAAAVALTASLVLRQIMVPAPDQVATIETAPGTVFSIQSSGQGQQDGQLDFGETMVISQGTAEITLADGSRCVAEAPARITLHNETRAHLSDGRAFFEVAKGSEGFVVTTKDIEVVDLGTAFAIDDRAEFQPQVHVIEGKVRATALSGRREASELIAGEAVVVGAVGTLRPIPSNGAGFFKQLPSELPSVRFSFDPDIDGELTSTGYIAQQEAVQIIDASEAIKTPTRIPGRIGGGLAFATRDDQLTTTWSGIGGSVPRTIALWVRIPEGTEGGNILGWGLGTGSRKMSDLNVTYSGDNLANLRLSSGRRWLQTAQRLDTGRWHHVAFLIDSPAGEHWPDVKCYVDGVREPMTPRVPTYGEVAPLSSFETVTDHPNSRPLIFGNPNLGEPGSGFTGELDEVVITAGILTKTEIFTLSTPSR